MSDGPAEPDSLPPPPQRPDPLECCGRGCDPCIFDYYDRALDRWKTKVRTLGHDPDALLDAAPKGG